MLNLRFKEAEVAQIKRAVWERDRFGADSTIRVHNQVFENEIGQRDPDFAKRTTIKLVSGIEKFPGPGSSLLFCAQQLFAPPIPIPSSGQKSIADASSFQQNKKRGLTLIRQSPLIFVLFRPEFRRNSIRRKYLLYQEHLVGCYILAGNHSIQIDA